jgi:hypothetical protein
MVGWLGDCWLGWLAGEVLACLAGCWFGCLAGCLTAWLLDWQAGWLAAAGLPFAFNTSDLLVQGFCKTVSQTITTSSIFQHKGALEDNAELIPVAHNISKVLLVI